jgi:D-glycero-D-manno-heptose 1,7-bisphosphate phosphatase
VGDRRAVFLDRDGTLMEEVDYCNDPSSVAVFPGVAGALQRMRHAGWLTVVVTNQSGLSKGRITPEQYAAVNAEFLRQTFGGIDAVYFCPDHPESPTPRRKPGTGMLEEAARDHGIDLARCWMVGDKKIDVECGRRAGCRSVLVRTGYGAAHEKSARADFVMDDAVAALDMILGLCRN